MSRTYADPSLPNAEHYYAKPHYSLSYEPESEDAGVIQPPQSDFDTFYTDMANIDSELDANFLAVQELAMPEGIPYSAPTYSSHRPIYAHDVQRTLNPLAESQEYVPSLPRQAQSQANHHHQPLFNDLASDPPKSLGYPGPLDQFDDIPSSPPSSPQRMVESQTESHQIDSHHQVESRQLTTSSVQLLDLPGYEPELDHGVLPHTDLPVVETAGLGEKTHLWPQYHQEPQSEPSRNLDPLGLGHSFHHRPQSSISRLVEPLVPLPGMGAAPASNLEFRSPAMGPPQPQPPISPYFSNGPEHNHSSPGRVQKMSRNRSPLLRAPDQSPYTSAPYTFPSPQIPDSRSQPRLRRHPKGAPPPITMAEHRLRLQIKAQAEAAQLQQQQQQQSYSSQYADPSHSSHSTQSYSRHQSQHPAYQPTPVQLRSPQLHAPYGSQPAHHHPAYHTAPAYTSHDPHHAELQTQLLPPPHASAHAVPYGVQQRQHQHQRQHFAQPSMPASQHAMPHPTQQYTVQTPHMMEAASLSPALSDASISPDPAEHAEFSWQPIVTLPRSEHTDAIIEEQRKPKLKRKSRLPDGVVDEYVGTTDEEHVFICLYPGCDRPFRRMYNLRSHIQTHLCDRPYICKLCNANFVRPHDLRRHERCHSTARPFLCPCGKGFNRQDAMHRHRQRDICAGGIPSAVPKSPKPRGRPKGSRSANTTPKLGTEFSPKLSPGSFPQHM